MTDRTAENNASSPDTGRLRYRSTVTLFIDHDDEIDDRIVTGIADDVRRVAARALKRHGGRTPHYTGTRSNGPGV